MENTFLSSKIENIQWRINPNLHEQTVQSQINDDNSSANQENITLTVETRATESMQEEREFVVEYLDDDQLKIFEKLR